MTISHPNRNTFQPDFMQINITNAVKFESRHNGPTEGEITAMLEKIGAASLTELINQTVPESIQLERPLNLPAAQLESEFLKSFKKLASKNKVYNSFIVMGYYDTLVPGVVLRNVLENPGWYTAYTPYQAEIAQGRLEALINFQTVVSELTGMELANASLLDEGTAAAEAMTMLHAVKPREKKNANTPNYPSSELVLRERPLDYLHPVCINAYSYLISLFNRLMTMLISSFVIS